VTGETLIYDAHMHVTSEDPDDALRILDACGIVKGAIMNKGYGRKLPNEEHAKWERVGLKILERYPDRFAVFATVDFSTMDEPDFATRAAAHFEEQVRRGVSGLKLWLGKPDHHWMALHDRRVGAVYEKAAELNVPVLIHVGDPEEYWEKEIKPDSFWYAILQDNPQWSFYGKPVPSREALFEEQRRMLALYPETMFICPHVGGHARNLEYVGWLLDEYPNLIIDTTAYEPVLGQDPERARPFLIAYQNRVLFGTDNGWAPHRLETLARRMHAKRLFYETDIEQGDLDGYMPRRPGYTMRGVNLPPAVMRKIYHENAARLIHKWRID
jgi:predicted TIM-barrel fold metal-dependent hydrolase